MARWIMWVTFVLCAVQSQGQTFDEWFEQNKTRKKYQEQQIGALQIYLGVLEKGYAIVESGLSTIKGIKAGEFNLHNSFYTSLRSVSPVVSGMVEVAEVATLQAATVERFSSALARYRASPGLRSDELAYLVSLYGEIVQEGLADVTLLGQILTDNTLEMSDDERMAGVLAVDSRARQRYGATVDVTNAADAVVAQRTARSADAGVVSQLYGLP
jgi:hypothetical protein